MRKIVFLLVFALSVAALATPAAAAAKDVYAHLKKKAGAAFRLV